MHSVGETSNINKIKCSRPHIVSKSLKMMAAWEGVVGKTIKQRRETMRVV